MTRILFYDDANGSGGHTITAIDAVKYILRNSDLAIDFAFFEGNNRLKNQLMILSKTQILDFILHSALVS
jgi:hypothetical protein